MTQVDVVDPDPTSTDPDPTPTAGPWEEYLAATQSLDAVRRDAAAAAAEATYVTSAARAELEQLRKRLEVQRARLTGEAVRAGLSAPQLLPTPPERAAADGLVGGDAAAAPALLRQCRALLDTGDVQLAVPPPLDHRGWRPAGSLGAVVLVVIAVAALACLGTLTILLFLR